MNIFKTKYRVAQESGEYYFVYRKKWYWPWWEYMAMFSSLEAAKGRIAMEKANPVWEE
jgi:hypothetical protein